MTYILCGIRRSGLINYFYSFVETDSRGGIRRLRSKAKIGEEGTFWRFECEKPIEVVESEDLSGHVCANFSENILYVLSVRPFNGFSGRFVRTYYLVTLRGCNRTIREAVFKSEVRVNQYIYVPPTWDESPCANEPIPDAIGTFLSEDDISLRILLIYADINFKASRGREVSGVITATEKLNPQSYRRCIHHLNNITSDDICLKCQNNEGLSYPMRGEIYRISVRETDSGKDIEVFSRRKVENARGHWIILDEVGIM
jgi:hypothetical protein